MMGNYNCACSQPMELLSNMLQALFTGSENLNVITATLPWLKIIAPDNITFNLHDEPLSANRFRINIVPAALICRLPLQCPLLA